MLRTVRRKFRKNQFIIAFFQKKYTMVLDAKDRIKAKHLGEHTDAIFSFALQNLIRIIGIRDSAFFHVVRYDPRHEFYPTKRQKSH